MDGPQVGWPNQDTQGRIDEMIRLDVDLEVGDVRDHRRWGVIDWAHHLYTIRLPIYLLPRLTGNKSGQ